MIQIVGIPVFSGTLKEAVGKVIGDLSNSSNCLVSATGAHGITYSRKNPEFSSLLKMFDMNLPDGMPLVWLGRIKGAHLMERCYGPRFFELVMRESVDRPIRHFLCGGKTGVAEDLMTACSTIFNNHNVVGWYTPPFREMDDDEMEQLGQQIMSTGADVVWIGMSTPKQEWFAARLARFLKVRFIITVGAAFDFHAGKVRQAPCWMQRAGLEWLFRLLMEPRRLLRRYIEVVPMFLYYAFVDLMQFWTRLGKVNESR